MVSSLRIVLVATTTAATVAVVSAFTFTFTHSAIRHQQHQQKLSPVFNGNRLLVGLNASTRLHASPSSTDDSNSVDGSFLELTSALAKASDSTVRNTRWTKLVLSKVDDDDDDDDEDHLRNQGSDGSETAPSSFQNQQQEEEYVWVLEPADVANGVRDGPSCTVLFTGGAGLGLFPHVAYNELLQRISNRLNAVVIAAPYTIGLDHFALAKDTGEKLRRGLIAYDNNNANGKKRGGSTQKRPVYGLAHSLGCKLQTIYLAATRQEYDGYGFMAFNNFSFAQTIKMARSFTDQIQKTSSSAQGVDPNTMRGSFSSSDWMKNAFDLAEVALGTLGIDFSPNANDMNRLIQLRYNDNYQSKTRLFVMDEDNMDSSSDFLEDCRIQNSSSSTGNDSNTDVAVSVSRIPGGHLAPVFFQWNLDDSMSAAASGYGGSIEDLPPEAREMAKEAMGGFQGASFGDEVALNALVDEICGWVKITTYTSKG